MNVSPKLSNSLTELNQAITAAENRLRKIPGSTEIRIGVADAMMPHDDDRETHCLFFGREQSGDLELLVEEYRSPPVHVRGLPFDRRLAVAEYIPTFIEAAIAEMDENAERVDVVSKSIHEAIELSQITLPGPDSFEV